MTELADGIELSVNQRSSFCLSSGVFHAQGTRRRWRAYPIAQTQFRLRDLGSYIRTTGDPAQTPPNAVWTVCVLRPLGSGDHFAAVADDLGPPTRHIGSGRLFPKDRPRRLFPLNLVQDVFCSRSGDAGEKRSAKRARYSAHRARHQPAFDVTLTTGLLQNVG
jgi:hypothetical protein